MKSTAFRKLVHERFDAQCSGKLDRDAVTGIIAFSERDEKEAEVTDFLRDNPEATLQDTLEYVLADMTEEMEIVDDDDLYAEWAADCGL